MTFVQVNGSWDGPNGSQWLLLKRQKHTKLNPVPGHVVTSVELHFRYWTVLGSSGIQKNHFLLLGAAELFQWKLEGNWWDMISCAKRKLAGIVDHAAPTEGISRCPHSQLNAIQLCWICKENIRGRPSAGSHFDFPPGKASINQPYQRVCSRKHSLDRKSSLHPQQPAKFWCENHCIRGPVPTYSMSSAMAVGTSGHIWTRGAQDLSGFGVSKDELQVVFNRCSYNFRPVEIGTALFHTFPLYFCSADAGSPSSKLRQFTAGLPRSIGLIRVRGPFFGHRRGGFGLNQAPNNFGTTPLTPME